MNIFEKFLGIGFGINQVARPLWLSITGSLGDIGIYWEKMIELGIMGFTLLLLYYLSILREIKNILRNKYYNKVDTIILCSIISYLISMMFHFLVSFPAPYWYNIALVLAFGNIIKAHQIFPKNNFYKG